MKDRCVEPGHWLIGGYHVKASFQGRSRTIAHWYIMDAHERPGTPPYFIYLRDVREWISRQKD